MKQNIVQTALALLIVVFLGASSMMIVPVEDANAWPMHISNCRWESTGTNSAGIVCDVEFHAHIWQSLYQSA